MNFVEPQVDFGSVESEPKIFTNLGESRLNCLSNLKGFTPTTKIESSIVETTHKSDIVAVLNLDNERFATGDFGGKVHIYDSKTKKDLAILAMNDATPITAMARIRCLGSDICTMTNVTGALTTLSKISPEDSQKKDQSEASKIWLLCAHAVPDNCIFMWDLTGGYSIKMRYDGHAQEISALLTLQDGHTFMSASQDGSVIAYDISYKNYVKKFWPGNSAVN
jgi:WD40 repeat protein